MSKDEQKIPAEITNAKEVVYSEKEKLGSGSIGNVYKGTCRGFTIAVKVPNKPKGTSKFSEKFVESFKDEVKILSTIYHPRIVLFMGAFISPKLMLLVLEFLDGNIQDKILKTEVSLHQKSVWLKQAAEGMSWLHGSNLIHGDLKPSNLLYHAKSHSLKISDFGVMSMKHNISGNDLGETLLYHAPEVLNSTKFSKGSDVYSYGLIIYFFVNGKHPSHSEKNELPKDENLCPSTLKDLALHCWDNSDTKRPPFEDIVKDFDNIILNCTILSQEGRNFWSKNFSSKGIQFEIGWDVFMKALSAYTNNTTILSNKSTEYPILKRLFCENNTNIVTLGRFGQIVGFFEEFGPQGWLEKVMETTSNVWFWGDLSGSESQKILAEKQNGSALVRFSSNGSNSTLSYRNDNKIWHTRIIHPYASKVYQIPDIIPNTKFSSMDELLVEFKKKANIKTFCEGSPYHEIFNLKKKNSKPLTPSGYAALEFSDD
eukprot:TRINITY_DN3133_c0_g1_i1.p1 TRINITY_DN3133_c0_g1~~TRINITY_DN3133_c0_g1_i1.p1  ORF type:complete len:484 (+),score=152.78 TRINITY_DN3133_c0_g1_i1:29-1480(+)